MLKTRFLGATAVVAALMVSTLPAQGQEARHGGTGHAMMEHMKRHMAEHMGGGQQGGMSPGMMGPNGMRSGMSGPHSGNAARMGRGRPGHDGSMMLGGRVMPILTLAAEDARTHFSERLARMGNKRLKVGPVEEVDADTIIVDIVTVDDSLVERFQVERRTGAISRADAG